MMTIAKKKKKNSKVPKTNTTITYKVLAVGILMDIKTT